MIDGNKKPTESQWREIAMQATRGTQLGAIVACALGRASGRPRFHGQAHVTSDGFVMCDFTDKEGRYHHGAFVGSMTDLLDNIAGLLAHLRAAVGPRGRIVSDADLDNLGVALRRWVARDDSAGAVRSAAKVA